MSNILVNQLTGNTTDTTIEVFAGHAADSTTRTNLEQGLAKAWVGTSGSGTPVVQDSFNNTSITDNDTGDYSFAFSNSMNNSNYSALSGGERSAQTQANISGHVAKSTSTHRHDSKDDTGNANDMHEGSYLVHGDLA